MKRKIVPMMIVGAMLTSAVPAQARAVAYAADMSALCPDMPLRIGGHSKGANLAAWAAIHLPADLQEKVPREFFINYSKEATLGQELRMVGCRKGGEYLMEGLGPEGVCFSAQCVF